MTQETETEFKAGGVYRTRSGRKALVTETYDDETVFPLGGLIYLEHDKYPSSVNVNWRTDGTYLSKGVKSGNDLVGPWTCGDDGDDKEQSQVNRLLCRPNAFGDEMDPYGDGRSE